MTDANDDQYPPQQRQCCAFRFIFKDEGFFVDRADLACTYLGVLVLQYQSVYLQTCDDWKVCGTLWLVFALYRVKMVTKVFPGHKDPQDQRSHSSVDDNNSVLLLEDLKCFSCVASFLRAHSLLAATLFSSLHWQTDWSQARPGTLCYSLLCWLSFHVCLSIVTSFHVRVFRPFPACRGALHISSSRDAPRVDHRHPLDMSQPLWGHARYTLVWR